MGFLVLFVTPCRLISLKLFPYQYENCLFTTFIDSWCIFGDTFIAAGWCFYCFFLLDVNAEYFYDFLLCHPIEKISLTNFSLPLSYLQFVYTLETPTVDNFFPPFFLRLQFITWHCLCILLLSQSWEIYVIFDNLKNSNWERDRGMFAK